MPLHLSPSHRVHRHNAPIRLHYAQSLTTRICHYNYSRTINVLNDTTLSTMFETCLPVPLKD
jgi:hypothetical protein